MITTTPQSKLDSVELDLDQTQARLNQLERHEWWRWSIAFSSCLFSPSTVCPVAFGQGRPDMAGTGAVEHHAARTLSAGSALRCFRRPPADADHKVAPRSRDAIARVHYAGYPEESRHGRDQPHNERRRLQRVGIDRRVRVNVSHEGKPTCVHGRIRTSAKRAWAR